MKIAKPEGVTPTERLLSTLCEKTFLKLWSWPNPRKDDGKELCDVLALFDDHLGLRDGARSRTDLVALYITPNRGAAADIQAALM